MEWRKNAGYIITNSITIGNSEIVLGVHETRPNAFVTWECTDKDNYFSKDEENLLAKLAGNSDGADKSRLQSIIHKFAMPKKGT